jgi:hypothetical protein
MRKDPEPIHSRAASTAMTGTLLGADGAFQACCCRCRAAAEQEALV